MKILKLKYFYGASSAFCLSAAAVYLLNNENKQINDVNNTVDKLKKQNIECKNLIKRFKVLCEIKLLILSIIISN